MLERLKAAGREQGADRFGFFAVSREPNDIRRPAEYVDVEIIFGKFGFEKTNLFVTFDCLTIQEDGRVEKTPNRLDLWIDRQGEESP